MTKHTQILSVLGIFLVVVLGSSTTQAQLTAWYDFEEDLTDATSNPVGLDGTYFGGTPNFGTGFQGQGLVFDGGDDNAVTVPINISPDMTPAVTIGAWVNVSGLNNLGDGIHTVVQSDGDFGRKILISDQSAAADATPGTTYYTAFTGRNFNQGFEFDQPAPAVTPVDPGNDGWVFLAASYNGYDRSTTIVAGENAFFEEFAYPNQAATYSYLNIGGLRAANGAIFEELIGTLDNVFVIKGAATQAQLESIRDAADPFAQAQAVGADIEAAGPTRTYGIDFGDGDGLGGPNIAATGMLGNETWNEILEIGGGTLAPNPIDLVDTEGNATGATFELLGTVSGGFNCAGCGGFPGANSHAQAGQDGLFRFNAQELGFVFAGLNPDATYRLTGIGSWNFNEFAAFTIDTDGDGVLDTEEVIRPFSGAIRSIGPGGTQDIILTPAADGTIIGAFTDAFNNGNTESVSGFILEEFAPEAPPFVIPEPSSLCLLLGLGALSLPVRPRRCRS